MSAASLPTARQRFLNCWGATSSSWTLAELDFGIYRAELPARADYLRQTLPAQIDT